MKAKRFKATVICGAGLCVLLAASGVNGAPPRHPRTCRYDPATIVGMPGDDRIRGTDQTDIIVAGAGDDIVRGLGDGDILCGGR